MKLFRTKPKPEDGAEEKELVLDTEAEATAAAVPEAEAKSAEPEGAEPEGAEPSAGAAVEPLAVLEDPSTSSEQDQPPPSAAEADPLAQLRTEAPDETAAGDEAPTDAPASPQPDAPASPEQGDASDSDLFDLFREAQNETEDATLASELPDISIQDLLGDLVSISQRLGISSPQEVAPPDPGDQEEHRSSRKIHRGDK